MPILPAEKEFEPVISLTEGGCPAYNQNQVRHLPIFQDRGNAHDKKKRSGKR